jgi:hypothetical protein
MVPFFSVRRGTRPDDSYKEWQVGQHLTRDAAVMKFNQLHHLSLSLQEQTPTDYFLIEQRRIDGLFQVSACYPLYAT